MYSLMYHGQTAQDCGAWLATIPIVQPSEAIRDRWNVPMVGELVGSSVYYGNAHIICTFHFRSQNSNEVMENLKEWLIVDSSLDDALISRFNINKLVITDKYNTVANERERFYDVQNITYSEEPRKSDDYGRLTVDFEVKPIEYYHDSYDVIEVGTQGTITNNHSSVVAKPLYVVICQPASAELEKRLIVNNKIFKIKSLTFPQGVQSSLVIDSEKMLVYSVADDYLVPVLNLSERVEGDYEDLWLKAGTNNISSSNIYSISVIPRWGSRV